MSYQTAKWNPISKEPVFSGGYVDNTDNYNLQPHFSPYLRNARLDGQSITIRPGHQVLSTLTAGFYPKGIIGYNNGLVVAHNTKLYFINTTTGASTEIIGKYIVGVNNYDSTVATWNAITDGSFKYGSTNITGLNFGADTTFAQILTRIEDAIDTATSQTNTIVRQEINLNSGSTKLVINGTETTISAVGSGTDIRTLMGVNSYSSGDLYTSTRQFTDNHRIEWVQVGNSLYIFGGEINSTSNRSYRKLTTLSLLGITDTGALPTAFQPSFGVVFNGSMFAGGWATNPNLVYKSVGDNYEDFNNTGMDRLTFQATITGLIATNTALFIFTKESISVIDASSITDTAGTITYFSTALNVSEGAVNHHCIVNVGTQIYYITPGNSIMQLGRGANISGFEALGISDKYNEGINKLLGTLAKDQSDCFGYYLPQENLIKWFLKTDGATFNDICIVYNLTSLRFTIDNQKFFYDGTAYQGYNYTVSNVESKVYKDEYSYDDEGQSIPFEYHTKGFYPTDPSIKSILWESRTLLDINELAVLTQEIYANGKLIDTKTVDKDNITIQPGGIGTQPIAEYPIGEEEANNNLIDTDYNEIYILRTKGNLNQKGRNYQFKYFCNEIGAKVRLKSLNIKTEPLSELATDLTI